MKHNYVYGFSSPISAMLPTAHGYYKETAQESISKMAQQTPIQQAPVSVYSWTAILLSFAGRAQLLPAVVHKNIQKIMTHFLWKGNIQSVGGVKVSWESTCLPREEGGLNIVNPKCWNRAQMLHHLCKVVVKSKQLWPLWVNTTVLKRSHFWTMKVPSDCSWIWRRILGFRTLALQFLNFYIGNGLNTSLWFDNWYVKSCLAHHNRDQIISQLYKLYNFGLL